MLERGVLAQLEPRRLRSLAEVALITGPAMSPRHRADVAALERASIDDYLDLADELPHVRGALLRAAAGSLWEAEVLEDRALGLRVIAALPADLLEGARE